MSVFKIGQSQAEIRTAEGPLWVTRDHCSRARQGSCLFNSGRAAYSQGLIKTPVARSPSSRTNGSCRLALPEITDTVVLHEYPERCDQNALSAFLADGAPAPALTKRPLADRRLHADHVPDARPCWRAVTAERVERAG